MAQATRTQQNHRRRQLPTTALLSQSDRTYQIEVALDHSDIQYETDPADPWAFDVLVIETPDRKMLRHAVEGKFEDTTVLFRMRGDPYWGIHQWYDHPFPPVRWGKKWVALKQLEWVDGCVAIAEHQANKYRRKSGKPTEIVQLSRDVSEWPDTNHTDRELRALSLTNCWYPDKIDPIIKHAGVVNDVLSDVGGQWIIGGKGRYEDRLAEGIAPYEHVHFPGYVDAKERLDEANIMLHFSQLDSFAGAILEGCASQLPVIASDHPAFVNADLPVDVVAGGKERLKPLLYHYADPRARAEKGTENERVVAEKFNHEQMGQDWQDVLQWFHHNA